MEYGEWTQELRRKVTNWKAVEDVQLTMSGPAGLVSKERFKVDLNDQIHQTH